MGSLCPRSLRAALVGLALVLLPGVLAATGHGDAFCSDTVCCQAVKADGKVTYTLSRPQVDIDEQDGFGWIAIGFGSTMAHSPMVIAWPFENSLYLSHREATAEVQPTVVYQPTVQATFVGDGSVVNGSYTKVAFSVDDSSAPGNVSIIWAYGATNPASSNQAANLLQHKSSGNYVLDLSKEITLADAVTTTVSAHATTAAGVTTAIVRTGKPTSTGARSLVTGIPTQTVAAGSALSASDWTPQQRTIVAHAVLGGVGMMVLLPVGVLVGRLARTYLSWWVRLHWILQAGLGGPIILITFALGVSATESSTPGRHFFSGHRRLGLLVLLVAFLQIILGTVIHVIPRRSASGKRAIQNWAHALVGLALLVLGYSAVWSGFEEFEQWSGLGSVSTGWKAGWGVLLGIFVVAYLLGLLLLRRQDRAVSAAKAANTPPRSGPPSIHEISAPLPGSGLLRRGSSQPLDEYDRPLTASRTISSERVLSHASSEPDGWAADELARGGGEGHEMRERDRWEGGRAI